MTDFFDQLAKLSPQRRALLERKLKQQGLQSALTDQIPRRPANTPAPLSFAQQRLWFVQQLYPTNTTYNVVSVLRLTGELNSQAMAQALAQLVQRQETLRTRFGAESSSEPQQFIEPAPSAAELLPLIPLTHASEAQQHIDSLIGKPFDLTAVPLRCALLQLPASKPQQHLLVLATHHILSDRWSVGVFLRELVLLYQAAVDQTPSPLPPLPIQYADYALWQRTQLSGKKLTQLQEYWQQQLAGELPLLNLPLDRPRPKKLSNAGGLVPIQLPSELSNELRKLAQTQQVTLFQLLLAGFVVLLHKYGQQREILIGTDVANRDRPETESLIGLLVNTLVLRHQLTATQSFNHFLSEVKQTLVDAMAHQELPFEQLVELLNPERHLDQLMPLFQAKFDFQLARVQEVSLAGLELKRETPADSHTKYELRFNLQDTELGINGQIEYSTDLFDSDTMVAMAEHFESLLQHIVINPDSSLQQLSLLSQTQRTAILAASSRGAEARLTNLQPAVNSVTAWFEQQVERTPQATAIQAGATSLSYQQLNQRANALARHLVQLGVTTEQPVGLLLGRSENLVIAMLATLKAGGCYVPLDPEYPQDRLQFIAEDAKLACVICDDRSQGLAEPMASAHKLLLNENSLRDLLATQDSNDLKLDILPNQLAYIIYTSGSTGRPKGVAIEHRSTLALLRWSIQEFSTADLKQVLAATSICFDLSVFEIFLPLVSGGSLRLVANAMAIAELAPDSGVSLINTVPSVLNKVLNVASLPASVRVVCLAGEPLTANLLQRLQRIAQATTPEAGSQLHSVYNLYGPSEDTTYSTWAKFPMAQPLPTGNIPIGVPIDGTQAYVLDSNLQPVPPGVCGELYLAGAGLARGYLQRPQLTAERFIDHDFQSEPDASNHGELGVTRLYKTGDLVRRRRDGQLDYLGRNDDQVKIRGYRIEIGEVDGVLRSHPNVAELVVSVQNLAGDLALVAYVELQSNPDQTAATDGDGLRQWAGQQLPSWQLPNPILVVAELPRLPNGKINRQALPAIEPDQNTTAYQPPENELEQTIADVWQQLLQRDIVGRLDNFFHLGGHSLLAMELAARVRQQLGIELPLQVLFEAPTVAGLAQWLQQAKSQTEHGQAPTTANQTHSIELLSDPKTALEPFPLTAIQQAYLVGRQRAFELGNISTHGYREIEVSQLTPAQVSSALNQLIQRHPMLRMVVDQQQQRILAKVPEFEIRVHDLQGLSDQHREQQLASIQERLSHQVFDPSQWPLFTVEASQLTADRIRFHLSFDVLIGDAWSFQLLGQELAKLLLGIELPKLDISFRDYVMAEQAFTQSPAYAASAEYWRNRLAELPAAPELPLAKTPSEIHNPEFTRRHCQLAAAPWQRLQQRAQDQGITPASLLLNLFAETLAAFCRHPNFTLNLTLFNRQPLHPQVNMLVGDFTSSLLLAVTQNGRTGFSENAKALQQQLWQDLEHRAVSGVQVQRELARQQQRQGSALMPVVFTSTLNQGVESASPAQWQAEFVQGVSQTSQVYLDHQVSEQQGALRVNWDSIDELFPTGLLDQMLSAYQARLEQLASAEADWVAHWNKPWASQRFGSWLTEFNATDQVFANGELRLQDVFFQAAERFGSQTAIITPELQLSYHCLADLVCQQAHALQQQGVKTNELVAVAMAKGWQQMVACLGVVAAGAAYVPIDPALPQARREELIKDTQARVLVRAEDDTDQWPAAITQLVVTQAMLEAAQQANSHTSTHARIHATSANYSVPHSNTRNTDLAYVIYTSGSTGKPKGVMIDHRGALNTLLDVNQRHQVGPADRVFGLSSLSFDLSVYDLFGTLISGATLVLPNADQWQQPNHWLELVQQHQVSIWNSVPALFQLLLDAQTADQDLASIRKVLLSGDWIPLAIPQRLHQQCPKAELIAMGGATEASIWSIDYPVTTINPEWRSIPYGRPLSNQQWFVLDEQFRPRPPWAVGQLFIGGVGLARGYWQRPQLSASQFVPNPFSGSQTATGGYATLYRTGDLGRYRPDGTIEFLGREDHQVKLHGYRVELGEIEAKLTQHPAVAAATAVIQGTPPTLSAFIVPALDSLQGTVDKLDLKANHSHRTNAAGDISLALPAIEPPESLLLRQSHRRFLSTPIALESLAAWLSVLRAWPVDDAPVAKYQYPSAGGLYPLRAYLEIKPGAVSDLEPGWYYYHPQDHQLVRLSQASQELSATLDFGRNQQVYDGCGVALYLAVYWPAIEPAYGEGSRDLALLEAGYVGQRLMEQGVTLDIGCCPVGGALLSQLKQPLLGEHNNEETLIHGLFAGAVDPIWHQQWQAYAQPAQLESNSAALQHWLKERLPAYMIPSRIQPIAKLPLSPNGKVDRSQLPQLDRVSIQFRAPTTDTEQRVCAIWQDVLADHLPQDHRLGLDDDFFALGGNSLVAMQLLSQLQQQFSLELNLGQLYGALTPGDQAQLINQLRQQQLNTAEVVIEKLDRSPVAEPTSSASVSSTNDTGSVQVDQLSADEVDQMLAQLMTSSEQP